jgi:hypothetical protein
VFETPALLVPPGDAPGLASAIVAMLGDRPAARANAARLRERVHAQFSQNTMVDGVLAAYEEANRSKILRSH